MLKQEMCCIERRSLSQLIYFVQFRPEDLDVIKAPFIPGSENLRLIMIAISALNVPIYLELPESLINEN